MNFEEVRHFCAKYLSETLGLTRLPEKEFELWFKSIDKDGSRQIDMVDMAMLIKSMEKAFQQTVKVSKQVVPLYDAIRERASKVTVGDIIQGN